MFNWIENADYHVNLRILRLNNQIICLFPQPLYDEVSEGSHYVRPFQKSNHGFCLFWRASVIVVFASVYASAPYHTMSFLSRWPLLAVGLSCCCVKLAFAGILSMMKNSTKIKSVSFHCILNEITIDDGITYIFSFVQWSLLNNYKNIMP